MVRVFAAMARERTDGLLVLVDSMFTIHRTRLAEITAIYRLPAVYGLRQYVEAGGLMAYGVNVVDYTEGAAFYIDKILKGARTDDLPVERPTKFEFVINLKTAKCPG